MKEYDLYIPLKYNDGSPVEPRVLRDLRRGLVAQFSGLTFFPQPNQGFWTVGDVTYRDEIVIYHVVAEKARTARRFLGRLKEKLKRTLKQEEIFIVERDVKVLRPRRQRPVDLPSRRAARRLSSAASASRPKRSVYRSAPSAAR